MRICGPTCVLHWQQALHVGQSDVGVPPLHLCPLAAQTALVKSRDMHWSLLAQRGQRDVSLSSLRMLIVADGANPCE